ncbi:MAG: hypothetical protein A3F14_04895 [Gammaproteobacteria bacterium RIFCSPHIGHO2_12_FULL_43_28]|nr:MAG: hypothetical protein A3F14_04895 [Gammaproteobacteria bacterium RIFCSPHIGHO2_12_FULL_43_28]
MWQYLDLAKEKFYSGCYLVKNITVTIGSTLINTFDDAHAIRNYLYDVASQVKGGATHALNTMTFNRLQSLHRSAKIINHAQLENLFLMLLPAVLYEMLQQYSSDENEDERFLSFNYSPLYLTASYVLICRWLQMQRNNGVYYNQAIVNTMLEEMPTNRNFEPCSDGKLQSISADIVSLIYFAGDLSLLLGVEITVSTLEKMLRQFGVLEAKALLPYHHAIFASTFLMRCYVYGKSLLEYRVASSSEVCSKHREEKLLKNNWYSLVYGTEYVGMNIILDELTRVFGIGNVYTSAVISSLGYQYFMATALLIDQLPGAHTGIDWLQPSHWLIDKGVEKGSAFILDRLRNRKPKIELFEVIKSQPFRYAIMTTFFEDIHAVDKLIQTPSFYYYLKSNEKQWRAALKAIKPFREKGVKSWVQYKSWLPYLFYYSPSVLLPGQYQDLQKLVGALLSDKADDVIFVVQKILASVDVHTRNMPVIVKKHSEFNFEKMIDDDYFNQPTEKGETKCEEVLEEKKEEKQELPIPEIKADKMVVSDHAALQKVIEVQPHKPTRIMFDEYKGEDLEFYRMPTPKRVNAPANQLAPMVTKPTNKSQMKRVSTPLSEDDFEEVPALNQRPTTLSALKDSLWQQPSQPARRGPDLRSQKASQPPKSQLK